MPKLLKKFIFSFLAAIYLLAIFSPKLAYAQEGLKPWYNQDFRQWSGKVFDDNPTEIFGERYTYAQVSWIIYSLFAFVIEKPLGQDIMQCINTGEVTSDCADQAVALIDVLEPAPEENNSSGYIWKTILADRPLSGITYFKDIGRKFHLVPEAQAQDVGFGFTALDPVRVAWATMRNATYILFIFVTIILAFMIMFRVKLSPQTVITLQSALPRVAIGIILITFSYAIAGFLIDLMYVIIGLISVIFANQLPVGPGTLFDWLILGPTFKGAGAGSGLFGWTLLYFILFILVFVITIFLGGGIGGLIGVIAGGFVASAFSGGIYLGVLGLVALVALVALILVLLWGLLRTFWLLLKTFTSILLLTIFAPFQILFGIILPGGGFGTWLRNYAANLAVFPTVGLMFVLAFFFLGIAIQHTANVVTDINLTTVLDNLVSGFFLSVGIVAPVQPWPPLLGGGDQVISLLFVMSSFIVVMMIPKAGNIIKSFVQGQPFDYGSVLGQAFGPNNAAAYFGAEQGIQFLEGRAAAAGRTTGADVATARVARKILGLKK